MQEYELSVLYLPPKDWPLRAEDWHDQVDKIIAYTRQTIAQDIVNEFETGRNYWIGESPTVHREFSIFKKCAAIARGKNE